MSANGTGLRNYAPAVDAGDHRLAASSTTAFATSKGVACVLAGRRRRRRAT
jgi:hypothetical protein